MCAHPYIALETLTRTRTRTRTVDPDFLRRASDPGKALLHKVIKAQDDRYACYFRVRVDELDFKVTDEASLQAYVCRRLAEEARAIPEEYRPSMWEEYGGGGPGRSAAASEPAPPGGGDDGGSGGRRSRHGPNRATSGGNDPAQMKRIRARRGGGEKGKGKGQRWGGRKSPGRCVVVVARGVR
jgi:hypothetical protein